MPTHFDHLTIVVRDIDRAKAFFANSRVQGSDLRRHRREPFASYMGVPGIEAEHVTLVLENVCRTEIQLLRYRHPILARSEHPRPAQARHEPHLLRGR